MALTSRTIVAGAFAALALAAGGAPAPAAVDMSTGVHYVIPSGTVDDCNAKAKTALEAYLQEATQNSPGEWIATGPIGATGPTSTTAMGSVHCYPSGKGYLVTFTCAVETPNTPYDSQALCLDIAHNFSGKPQKPLPTPTPMPTGCTTANLIGTWQSDDNKDLTLTLDSNGGLTGSDGVSGNWILYNNSATLTYYGNHTMTLSSDGKHLHGGGYNLTRKC